MRAGGMREVFSRFYEDFKYLTILLVVSSHCWSAPVHLNEDEMVLC